MCVYETRNSDHSTCKSSSNHIVLYYVVKYSFTLLICVRLGLLLPPLHLVTR